MKFVGLVMAALLCAAACNARAVELFVGVDGEPFVWWKDCNAMLTCANSGYDGHSAGYGGRIGLWMEHDTPSSKYGFEMGYDRLGGISGTKPYLGTAATWKNTGNIVYVDWQGYAVPPRLWETGGLIGKIGLYSSKVKTDTNFGTGGYTRTVSGGGLMMGAGYAYPFNDHLMLRAAGDVFFAVAVPNPIDKGSNLSQTLVKFIVGLDFTF